MCAYVALDRVLEKEILEQRPEGSGGVRNVAILKKNSRQREQQV